MSVRPCDGIKVMAIASGVSPPKHGEVAAFVFSTSFLFNFLNTIYRSNDRVDLAHNGSNDAVPPKEVFWGWQWQPISWRGLFPPPKMPISLAGSQKTHDVFGYIFMNDQLKNIRFISNFSACDQEEYRSPRNWWKMFRRVLILKRSPHWKNPCQISQQRHMAKS